MVYFIVNWVLSVVGLLIVSGVVPGFRISDFSSALLATGVVGLISAGLGAILKSASGAFSVAVSGALLLIADAALLRLSALTVPGYVMRGFLPAAVGGIALLALNLALMRAHWTEHPFDRESWQRS